MREVEGLCDCFGMQWKEGSPKRGESCWKRTGRGGEQRSRSRKQDDLILRVAKTASGTTKNVEDLWSAGTTGSATTNENETCVRTWGKGGKSRGCLQMVACGDWTLSGAVPATDVSAMRESHQREHMGGG